MSDDQDWREAALELRQQVGELTATAGRLELKLREETALREQETERNRQRITELHALLALVLGDQHIARVRIDAEEDVHAALSDSEKARDYLLSDALGNGTAGRQRHLRSA